MTTSWPILLLVAAGWSATTVAAPVSAPPPAPSFVDVAAAAGLVLPTDSGGLEKAHLLESTGNGVLVLDYDGDGLADLYLVAAYRLPRRIAAPGAGSRLYRNRGNGSFEDVTERSAAGLDVYGHGGCVGDADGDLLPDLYITAFGPNVLLRNRGDGTFEEVVGGAGAEEPGWSIGCAFFDADGDGDLDLYVANYVEASWNDVGAARRTRRWRDRVAVMDGPRGLPEAASSFYRNRGDGVFVDATEDSGLGAGRRGYSMAVAAFDADLDGDLDLYVANDSTPNRFYRNRGPGVFEEVGTESGTAFDGDGQLQGSMGVGVGDLNGDGLPDLVVTNFAHDHATLYSSVDGRFFVDASFASGLAAPTYVPLGWAALPFDADLDGELDLFLANGHIYPQVDEDLTLNETFRQRNQLLVGRGGRFEDVSDHAGTGLEIAESSRGAALFDLEGDGDLDIAISNQDAPPTLLRNDSESLGHWLAVVAPGAGLPVSAWAVVRAAGRRRTAQRVAGGSYASESEAALRFGLGTAVSAERLELSESGAPVRAWLELPADRVYVLPPGR